MISTGKVFEIVLNEQAVNVEIYLSGKIEIYKVHLKAGSFFLTKSKDAEKRDFWTSLPQGKQEFAEKIGELIDRAQVKAPKGNNSTDIQPTLF